MMMNHDYNFEFPAIRGEQGGREQYILFAPMNMLKRILAVDSEEDVMSRSQRELNSTRAKKITRYLTDGYDTKGDYILGTLTGNIDRAVQFRAADGVKGEVGTVFIPMDATIKLFDGQHRARGIIDYIHARPESTDMVTLLLSVGLSRETRQQFFSDINNNASKPATAISMAYNHKDPLNELVHHIATAVPALRLHVDYEHNVVPGKSGLLVSFKALHDATRKMFSLRAGDAVPASLTRDAERLWKAWAEAMNWSWVVDILGAATYRTMCLGTHGVMVNAIGIATAMMLEHHTADSIAERLTQRPPETDRSEAFRHDNWQGICVDAATGTVKCDAAAQHRAAIRLLELFGLDPSDPNAWLREACDDSVSDERVAELVEKVEKVAAEKKLPMETLKFDIPVMLARSEGAFLSTLGNLRTLRQWAKTQYPDSPDNTPPQP
ncbi:DGQHR domain-containing protein [Citrobacter braakii]|uniref:DGQHR domain-containing protein n=1 Tax=Citrobacter braakii TaxID=57706 RepID=UPI00403923FF